MSEKRVSRTSDGPEAARYSFVATMVVLWGSLFVAVKGSEPKAGVAGSAGESQSATAIEPSSQLRLPNLAVSDRVSVARKLQPKERHVYARLDGPGCIRRFWITPTRWEMGNRQTILRIYFDGAETPHVEAPVGDFFGVMHGKMFYPINTPYLSAAAETGYTAYFAMPFAREARIEFEGGDVENNLILMVDWHRYPGQELKEPMRFCARWRRELPAESFSEDYLLLDAEGEGRLLGFFYGVRLLDDFDRWSHGGGDNLYIDGDGDHPAYLRGIGGEDTFGAGYGGAQHNPPESYLYQGMPYYTHEDTGEARPAQRIVGYRWFERDPVRFQKSLQVRFGCMQNDICSTVYWYQTGAVRPFFRIPTPVHITAMPRRLERIRPDERHPRGTYDLPRSDHGDWRLCGPFANETALKAALSDASFVDPKKVFEAGHAGRTPYLSDASRERGLDKARWVKKSSEHGFIDFNHVFRCAATGPACVHSPAVAIARSVLDAPQAGKAAIRIVWDDALSLRVNDSTYDFGTQSAFRDKTLDIPLQKGRNEVTVTLNNTTGTNHGGWTFAFRATTQNGQVLFPRAE